MRLLLILASLVLAVGCSSDKNDSKVSAQSSSEVFHDLNIGNKAFGLKGSRKLVLTIDDGPNESTISILKLLKKYGIKSAFFINGKNVPKYEAALPAIIKEGHNLSNHSEHHYSLRKLTAEQIYSEIASTDKILQKYVPKNQTLYFRAPGGGWNYSDSASEEVLKAVTYLNQDKRLSRYVGPVFWSIGGVLTFNVDGSIQHAADWDCWIHKLDTNTCAQGYLNEIEDTQGGVMLVHDTPETYAMLRVLIPTLLQEGYEFVTLEQLRGLRGL